MCNNNSSNNSSNGNSGTYLLQHREFQTNRFQIRINDLIKYRNKKYDCKSVEKIQRCCRCRCRCNYWLWSYKKYAPNLIKIWIQWISQSVSQSVSESVSEWVSQLVSREFERRRKLCVCVCVCLCVSTSTWDWNGSPVNRQIHLTTLINSSKQHNATQTMKQWNTIHYWIVKTSSSYLVLESSAHLAVYSPEGHQREKKRRQTSDHFHRIDLK